MDPKRNCKRCGERFVGRSDKIFCCDSCRNDYHNYLRRERNKGMNLVNSILSRNREIIRSLLSKGIASIDTRQLSMLSFDFGHFTSIDKRILGRTCYHIYEYCYYYSNGVVHFSLKE